MDIGSFTVEILSEGHFELFEDGHINRSERPAHSASSPKDPNDSNSVMVGVNPVLVQSQDQNILLDTGLGWGLDAGSRYTNVSNVCTLYQSAHLRSKTQGYYPCYLNTFALRSRRRFILYG